MLSSKAAHPELHAQVDELDHPTPKVQAQVAGVVRRGAGEPQGLRRDLGQDHCTTFSANDQAFYDKVAFWATPVRNCRDGRGNVCVDYSKWVQAWTEIKGLSAADGPAGRTRRVRPSRTRA